MAREIIVRRPLRDESIEAIDHKTYQLDADFCVIADARRAVAIAGVMGGAATEVNEATCDVLIEAAEFDPVSVRTTARRLGLHSDSSYRFERGVDAEGVDWASRRCAELILETAGGELAAGVVDVGRRQQARQPIVLRLSQLKRILGIEVEPEVVRRILRRWEMKNGQGGVERGDGRRTSPRPPSSLPPLPSVFLSLLPLGGETSRGKSISSKRLRGSMATTRFPRTSASPWRHLPDATTIVSRPRSVPCSPPLVVMRP